MTIAVRRAGRLGVLAIVMVGLAGLPSRADAASALVALELKMFPSHVALIAPVTFYGSVTRVSGTPKDVRIKLELPGSYTSGDCEPACVSGTRFEWEFPTVTGRTTFKLSARWTGLGEKAFLFIVGGNAGCASYCPTEVDLTAATPTIRAGITYHGGSPVVTGSTIHVRVAGSANASPIDGTLTLQLPAGVGAPTNLTGGAAYAGDPWYRVEGPVTLRPTGGFEFDLPITAANGTSLAFDAWFTPAASNPILVNGSMTVKVGPDSAAPTATAPKVRLVTGPRGGGAPIRLTWTGTDAGSGVERYVLARQVDDGAWQTISSSLTEPATTLSPVPGHRYRFRVRPVDHAGNVGAWAYGAAFRLSKAQETSGSIAYGGSWTRPADPRYWGGRAKSGAAGATARFTVTARSVSWVSAQALNRGRAIVLVNGKQVATVDLWTSKLRAQQVVWSASWGTTAKRTITVRVLPTPGRPRVEVDGFLSIR